jgi:hypothetical protein
MPIQSDQVGASIEVLRHHWELHCQVCPTAYDLVDITCPDGQGDILICRSCFEPIFMVMLTDGLPCEHFIGFFDGRWSE